MAYPDADVDHSKVDGTVAATDHPGHHNTLAVFCNDVKAELGSGPKGTAADLTTRLSAAQVDTGAFVAVNAQTGTTYTPVLADAGKIVTLSNAGAITLTIPPNSSVAYVVGTHLDFIQKGAGQVTCAQGSGVTIESAGGTSTAPKARAQYCAFTAIKVATDEWIIVGDIS